MANGRCVGVSRTGWLSDEPRLTGSSARLCRQNCWPDMSAIDMLGKPESDGAVEKTGEGQKQLMVRSCQTPRTP